MGKAASVKTRRGERTGEADRGQVPPPSPFPLQLPQKPPRPTRRRVAAGPPPGQGRLGLRGRPPGDAANEVASTTARPEPAIATAVGAPAEELDAVASPEDSLATEAAIPPCGLASPEAPPPGLAVPAGLSPDSLEETDASPETPPFGFAAPAAFLPDSLEVAGAASPAASPTASAPGAAGLPAVASPGPAAPNAASPVVASPDAAASSATAPAVGSSRAEAAPATSAARPGAAAPSSDPDVDTPAALGPGPADPVEAEASLPGPARPTSGSVRAPAPRAAARRAPASPPAIRGWPAQGFGVTPSSTLPARTGPSAPPAIRGWPAQGFGATTRVVSPAAAPAPQERRPVVKVSLESAAAAANRVPAANASVARPVARPAAMAPAAAPAGAAAPVPAPAAAPRPTRSVPFPATTRRDADDAPPLHAIGAKKKPPIGPVEPLPALRLPRTDARLVEIEDLSAPHCAARVQAAVARLPGVEEAEASAGTGLLAVRPARVDPAAVAQAVAAAGHRVAASGDRHVLRRPLIAAGLAAGAGLVAWAVRALAGAPAAGVPVAAAAIAAAWPTLGPAVRHAIRGRFAPDLLPLASSLVILVGALAGADVPPEAAAAPLVVHLLALAGAEALRSLSGRAADRLAAALPDGAGPKPGTRLELPPGAIVPADGRLLAGAPVDETPLGGAVAERVANELVTAGTVLPEGGTVEVVTAAERSLARRALAAARRAAATSAGSGRWGLAAKWFPVAIAAVALAGGILGGVGTAAAVLAAASPLALAAAAPLALAAGLGRAVSLGAVPRSVEALLRAGSLRAVIFDRTSAVVRGAGAVTDLVTRPGGDALEALRLAAAAEAGVDHPIARALERHAHEVGLALPAARDQRVAPGRGVRARVQDREVAIGSTAFLASLGVEPGALAQAFAELGARGRTPVLIAVDGTALAVAGIADSARESARRAMGRLELRGLDLHVAGGDAVPAMKWLARTLGLETSAARGELEPEGKRELVARVKQAGTTAFVSGAAVDAPALAAADLGVSVNGSPEAELDAAALLVRPDPAALASLVETGRATRLGATTAAGVALAGNAAGLALAASGAVGPLGAAVLALATTALALASAAALALLPTR